MYKRRRDRIDDFLDQCEIDAKNAEIRYNAQLLSGRTHPDIV
jgi:hypothetical protein